MLCYVIRKSITFSVIPSILFYYILYTNTYDFNFSSPFRSVQYVCVCVCVCVVETVLYCILEWNTDIFNNKKCYMVHSLLI